MPAARDRCAAADAAQFDSEALWAQVRAQVRAGARVLIVRGGDASGQPAGRDWLAREIAAAGGAVRHGGRLPAAGAAPSAMPSAQWPPRAHAAAPSGCSAAPKPSRNLRRALPATRGSGTRDRHPSAHRARPRASAGFGTVRVSAPGLDGAGRVDRILRMSDASVSDEPLQEPVARAPVPVPLQAGAAADGSDAALAASCSGLLAARCGGWRW